MQTPVPWLNESVHWWLCGPLLSPALIWHCSLSRLHPPSPLIMRGLCASHISYPKAASGSPFCICPELDYDVHTQPLPQAPLFGILFLKTVNFSLCLPMHLFWMNTYLPSQECCSCGEIHCLLQGPDHPLGTVPLRMLWGVWEKMHGTGNTY